MLGGGGLRNARTGEDQKKSRKFPGTRGRSLRTSPTNVIHRNRSVAPHRERRRGDRLFERKRSQKKPNTHHPHAPRKETSFPIAIIKTNNEFSNDVPSKEGGEFISSQKKRFGEPKASGVERG